MTRHALLLASSIAALTASAHAEAPFSLDGTPGKLAKTVIPGAYRIDLVPDLEALRASGEEWVDIEVRAPTRTITLNQIGLTLGKATLDDAAAGIAQDDAAQTATLTFPDDIAAGKHTLRIAWTGPIPQTPSGLYYDDYKTAAGQARRMLVTQLEVADARRMFPCWDEPAFKATFQLSVTLPRDMPVISNMPVATTEPADGDRSRVAFETSPRMSTYLLALVAGDMAAVRGEADGVRIAAWAPAGLQDQAGYALSVASRVLPYYDDYFGVAYPLPKLDMIAVPGNFAAGGMENWGAITYIDNALLFDPASSGPRTRELISIVVAHEMAHQWSGDLVTMGWWDNVWLNEGFATWMESKVTDHLNPTWEIWPREHASREQAMEQDASPKTHALRQPIRDETEANSAFDRVSYEKGEQIIRMIENWVGPDVFRDGMRRYMRAHAYGNSTSADLWAALGQAAGRDVSAVAESFTEQPGIPLVHVARTCVNGVGAVTVTQDRFAIHDPDPKPLTWQIPLTLAAPDGHVQRALLGDAPVMLPLAACDAPVKANADEDGYYRSQYDAASLAALRGALSRFGPADRANLLGDQFALFLAGRAALSDYLDLLTAAGDERDVAVWQDTLAHLRQLDRTLEGTDGRAAFDAWASGLIRPELARLGWDGRPGEEFLDSLLRPELITALGRFGDAATVAEADRRFAAFRADPRMLDPSLRDPVMLIVGHHADQDTYDALKELGIKSASTEEKLRYFGAMAAADNPRLIEQTVAFADSGEVPNGRVLTILGQASLNSGKPEEVFRLVAAHEASLVKRLPQDGSASSPLAVAAFGSSDPATARALLAAPSSTASAGAKIQSGRVAERIEAAAELRTRTERAVALWLAER